MFWVDGYGKEFEGQFNIKKNIYQYFFEPPPSSDTFTTGESVPRVIPVKGKINKGIAIGVKILIDGVDFSAVINDININASIGAQMQSFSFVLNLEEMLKNDLSIDYGDKISIYFLVEGQEILYFEGYINSVEYLKSPSGTLVKVAGYDIFASLQKQELTGDILTKCMVKKGHSIFSRDLIVTLLSKYLGNFEWNQTINSYGIEITKPFSVVRKNLLEFLNEIAEYNGWILFYHGGIVYLKEIFSDEEVAFTFLPSMYDNLQAEKRADSMVNKIVTTGEHVDVTYQGGNENAFVESVEEENEVDENGENYTKIIKYQTQYFRGLIIDQKKYEIVNGRIQYYSWYRSIPLYVLRNYTDIFSHQCSHKLFYIHYEVQDFYNNENGKLRLENRVETYYYIDMHNLLLKKKIKKVWGYIDDTDRIVGDLHILRKEEEKWLRQDDNRYTYRKAVYEIDNNKKLRKISDEENTSGNVSIPKPKLERQIIKSKEINYILQDSLSINKVGERKETFDIAIANTQEDLKKFAKYKMKKNYVENNTVSFDIYFNPFLKLGDIFEIEIIPGEYWKYIISGLNVHFKVGEELELSMKVEGWKYI